MVMFCFLLKKGNIINAIMNLSFLLHLKNIMWKSCVLAFHNITERCRWQKTETELNLRKELNVDMSDCIASFLTAEA